MPRQQRHDQISFHRQRYLAVFLLTIDTSLFVFTLIYSYKAKWHLLTPDRFLLTGILLLASVIFLLLAAGAVGGCRDMWNGFISIGGDTVRHRDTDFFAKHRMVFFYIGVNLNILTLSVLVEQTGGITASPYVAVFFAFILTGQQLSRFKTQSSFLISAGVLLTIVMWIYESTAGPLKGPAAPRSFTFLVVAATFIACGFMTNYEKDHNYLIEGKQKLPTHAHIYRDARNEWHYVIYCQRHRLDPLVGAETTEGAEKTLEQVRSKVESIVTTMYHAAGWGRPKLKWREDDARVNSLILDCPPEKAGITIDAPN